MKDQEASIDLKWSRFQTNFPKTFEHVRASKDFSDVTLACDDEGLVEAHRIILASGSLFFQKLLSAGRLGPNPHPLLYLRGVTAWQLEAVLDFLYSGETRVRQGQLNSFLELAQQLGISGLVEEEPDWLLESESANENKVKSISNASNQSIYKEIKMFPDEDNYKLLVPEEKEIETETYQDYLEDRKDIDDVSHPLPVHTSAADSYPFPARNQQNDLDFPWAPGPPSSWQNQGNIVKKMARRALNYASPHKYGEGYCPAWDTPISTSSLVCTPSLKLAAGAQFLVLSDFLPWTALAGIKGSFGSGPGEQKFLRPARWKNFCVLLIELLAEFFRVGPMSQRVRPPSISSQELK